jgi:hypothetical protein
MARMSDPSGPANYQLALPRGHHSVLDYIRDIHISESAIRAKEETPGEPSDAVVWEQLEQSAGEEARLSITYLCFMIVATMITGIGSCLISRSSLSVLWSSARSLMRVGLRPVVIIQSSEPIRRHNLT